MSETRTDKLALWCDRAGVIQKILHDDFFPAGSLRPGQALAEWVDPGSREKVSHLLAEVDAQGYIFDWELVLTPHGQETTLAFSGIANGSGCWLVGDHAGGDILQLQQELTRVNNEQFKSTRMAAKDQSEVGGSEDETDHKNRRLTLLNQLGQTLNQLASPAEILERISALIGQVFDNRNLYIALYDEQTNFVSFPIYWVGGERKHTVQGRPLGHGLTEWVIRARTPVLISDHVARLMAERGIELIGTPCQCYLGVPMLMNDHVMGVIAVQDYERENVYAANDVELLTTIAAQAAIAFENARLYEAIAHELSDRQRAEESLRQRTAQVEALRQISLALTADMNFHSLLQSITLHALELVGGTTCSCYLYNPELDQLERLSFGGPVLVPTNRSTRRRGEGLIGQVWETDQPILTNDYNAWDKENRYDQYPTRAVLAVPVKWGEEFLGVLNIVAERPKTYTQSDLEQMTLLSAHAALAIRNAQMYQQIQQELTARATIEQAERKQRVRAEELSRELALLLEHEQNLARTDQLTGIPNRRDFLEMAEHELKRAARLNHPFVLSLIDLDHLKSINDTYGHAAGDQALIEFANTCRKNIRDIDVFARFGGDEFAFVMTEADGDQGYRAVERLRQSLWGQALDLNGHPVSLTLSAGIACLASADPDVTLDMLLGRADQALYRAKEAGRNRVLVAK